MFHPLRIATTATATAAAMVCLIPAAQAAQPSRDVFDVSSDDVYTGWCAFPVRLQESGKVTVLTFDATSAGVSRESDIASQYRGVLTNEDTGTQLALNYPGSLHITYYANGTHTTRGTGPNLIAAPVPSPATGRVGLWLIHGQFTYDVAADDRVVSSSVKGTEEDLCQALGG
ncbi:hypothetical protein [Pedococcus sp. 5OH_020]|uniref:hypothetical protein n=1 Tax=Pedococcus sp. 5OH_020 TaxID=2989814 RepID=UPI0022E9D520|nr:hypothetical protein [Pedococcus sp. 5OH_020]